MKDYTYIVFGESGLYISKLLKDYDSDIKIIHFQDGYYNQYSSADIKVDLTIRFSGCIANDHVRNKMISEDERVNKDTTEALKKVKKAIIFDDLMTENYSMIISITKKLVENKIQCHNIIVKPFDFFGRKRANYYKEFYDEITKINKNHHCFICEDLNNYDIRKYDFKSMIRIVDVIQYNIAMNLEKDINLIIKETMNNEFPNMELRKTVKEYTYISVVYDDDIVARTIKEPSFYYISEIEDINIGDKVLVNRNRKDVVGIIIDIKKYDEDKVPFPVERTKKIIKVLEKAKQKREKKNKGFFIDPFDEYMLIICDSEDVQEKLNLYRTFTVKSASPNLKELIDKCNIIVTVGNVDITKYDLSEKYVININNEVNDGRYTVISYFSKEEKYIQMIRAIHYVLFYSGFITLDLYDVENALNGRIEYKKFPAKNKDKVFKEFDVSKCKKIFIIFEAPTNYSLYEISDIVNEFRDKYVNSEIDFGVPIVEEVDELIIDIFYEENSTVSLNCGKRTPNKKKKKM